MKSTIVPWHLMKRQIEPAVQAIFPERTIYVVFADEVPPRYRPNGVFGLTGRGLDLVFRDQIGPRWRGRGSVILLSVENTVSYVRTCGRLGNPAIYAKREVWVAATHELVHIAGRQVLPLEDAPPDSELSAISANVLRQFCAVPPTPAIDRAIGWHGHDGAFIRLLIHAAYRIAPRCGLYMPGGGWFDPRQYGLPSREDQYRAALGDEPERLAHVPLTLISVRTPPPAFASLWRADVHNWFSSIPDPTDGQTDAWMRGLRLFPRENNAAISAA